MLLDFKKIFIVEDNIQNRVIFQMTLLRHGAVVDFDRWGRDTFQRLQGMFHVDLIILDLMLAQGASGFDIYDEIRTLEKLAHVPIVAVSAMDPAIAIPKVRKKGFAGFIAKPVDTDLFPRQIAKIIEGEQVWYVGDRFVT
jgi:two-component system, cell cycle response regulator DivK